MTSAVALGLMLTFGPKKPGITSQPPRRPDQPFLISTLMARILSASTLLVAGSWWLFQWEQSHGASLEKPAPRR